MANSTTPYKLPDGRQALNVTENKTFPTNESGIVQNIIADALTLTAPASATVKAGYTLILRNGGVPKTSGPTGSGDNGSLAITLTPASGDGVTGNLFTAAINKGPVNTKLTDQVGDEITLVAAGTNDALAWQVQSVKGTWARLA
jgi:hypothetical protein